MTSKIVVNNIEADTGINTVTFNSNISGNLIGNVNATGVSTFSNIRVTGGTISGVSTAGITTVYTNSINNGQLGGSRNIIINGSMVVNQRGFTGAAGTTIDASFPIDRFKLSQSNSAVVSAGQTSMNSTVGGNAYADGFQNALFLRVTTAQSSLSAGNFQIVQQNIEGYNLQGIKKGTANAQPITLSFWVRSNTIGTYIVDIHDNDNTRSCSQSYSINVANTWEKKVLTFPADTTGVFDNDNNLSAYLNWWLASGTTYNSGTLQTSWAAITNANRAVGQINLLATVNNEFWLTGVQLEVGDRATEFERRSYGDELRLCQRYFCGVDTRPYSAAYHYFGTAVEYGASTIMCGMTFPVTMRARPTSLFISDRNTFYIGGYTSFTSATYDQAGVAGGYVLFNGSGFTNPNSGRWLSNNNNTAYCYFSAEL